MGDTRLEHTDYSTGNTPFLENRGVESGALSVDSIKLAHDPELVTLCRLWPSLAADLRDRIKAMIVEAVTAGQ